LAELDAYRRRFDSAPDTLTNSLLMGTLLIPLGISLHPPRQRPAGAESQTERRHGPMPRLGDLPLARRDVERLRQMIGLQRRLHDLAASPRAQRGLLHRSIFRDALTWLEVHGDAPEVVAHWKALAAQAPEETPGHETAEGEPPPFRRKRRRRRRRRFRPVPT
ncbi:MAG: hypothetical protein HY655_06610, partial [Acidobacteria bacterium]|nr:hypothetical protein [Acidobacteriota bacterium]